MAPGVQRSLSKQILYEALAWTVALAVAMLLGGLVPEPLSSLAYGFGVMVGLALADLVSWQTWATWRRRHGRELPPIARPQVHSVLGEAIVGGLCVALARQFAAQHGDALMWLAYGLQALMALGVVAIAMWVWWGVRQLRRNGD